MKVKSIAPAKIILSGEHSVAYGRNCVLTSISLYTQCEFERSKALDCLKIVTCNYELSWELTELEEGVKRFSASDSYEQMNGFIDKLLKYDAKGDSIDLQKVVLLALPLEIKVTSDIPRSSGLGSSASVCVSLAAGLLAISGIIRPEDLVDGCLQKAHRKFIKELSFKGEEIIHVKPSGVDNSVVTFGGLHKMNKNNMEKLENSNIKFLIIDTKIPRKTRAQVEKVGKLYKKFPDVTDRIFDAIDEIAKKIASLISKEGQSGDIYESLSTLIGLNQSLLRTIGVSRPEIDHLCEMLRNEWGLHAKIVGAGYGGCLVTLLDSESLKKVDLISSEVEKLGYTCINTQVETQGAVVSFPEYSQKFGIVS